MNFHSSFHNNGLVGDLACEYAMILYRAALRNPKRPFLFSGLQQACRFLSSLRENLAIRVQPVVEAERNLLPPIDATMPHGMD